jgi:hypothetical protein
MRLVYSLRSDPGLKAMQDASQSDGAAGLKQTHGLVGSDDWWRQIEDGSLPVHCTTGQVIHFWPGHHGDWPEIEIREPDGTSSNWGCQLPVEDAARNFTLGTCVAIDHVQQEFKTPFNGSNFTCVVVAM